MFIVWNANKTEGFVTDDRTDANEAMTGEHGVMGCPLAERFYELYGEGGECIKQFIPELENLKDINKS